MSEVLPAPSEFPAPVTSSPDLLVIAGEHSGDEHAAQLIRDLLQQRPELQLACLGGPQLHAAGAQLLYDMTEVSIVGFVEVAKHYGFFRALFERTLDWIERYQPKHICFVDYPGFNLRLAQELKKRALSKKGGGTIGLSYYIGPQIWAWKAKRRFKMAGLLDRLGVIFPFEVDCYQDTALPVEFVGHPFVCADHQLPFRYDPKGAVLLLPGSRVAAVSRIFPVLLEAFRLAKVRQPELKACVLYPSERIRGVLLRILGEFPELQSAVVLKANSSEPQVARAVLMSSGTMSLAVALAGIPGAIVYRLNSLSYWIGRFVVRVESIGISNLLLKKQLHPEFIQAAAQPKVLAAALLRACDSDAAIAASRGADEIRALLNPGSATRAADWLASEL